jgi:hypothetical protein
VASWIEKKEVGDARVQEDGSASHRLHFRSGAGLGIAESVTQGYVFGATLVVNGITLTLTGKSTSQDGVYEDVFLEYTLPGTKPGNKLPPVGTIERSMVNESNTRDCEIVIAKGIVKWKDSAEAAKARGEPNIAVPETKFIVKKSVAWSWSEANISTEIGQAATPVAYISDTPTGYKWEASGVSIDAGEDRAVITMKWTFLDWRGAA